jgi:hypothetical protein
MIFYVFTIPYECLYVTYLKPYISSDYIEMCFLSEIYFKEVILRVPDCILWIMKPLKKYPTPLSLTIAINA